ncbi:DUF1427 family protein [Streptomyces actuosus]|uniref:DUF1427 family protein n=1 Tax=Streptomyces actuosus TaxID=1885 RepID=A0ABS2VHF5_STRAS|nr:DUF1427 family protein [Streptomyces actuosus]
MTARLRRCAIASAAGLPAGAVFRLLGVPSPAPPWSALCALLGILMAERLTARARTRHPTVPSPRPSGRLPAD